MQIINEEQVNPCLTSIEIEISKEEFEPSVNKAYKSAAKQINVPGFRKGKAPKMVLKQYVEPKYIAEYAAEDFVEKSFDNIIELSGKKPFAQCTFDLVDYNDAEGTATIKFTIPTEPIVKLGEYKGVEVNKYVKEVTDEDVKKQLDEFVAQRTHISPILNRPSEMGDNLFIDIKNNDDAEAKSKPTRQILGDGPADLDNALVGMEQGDDKDVTVNYPADYSDAELAGKTINYHVKVRNIYNNVAPEVNDEFIQEIFKNAPALPDGKEYPKTVDEYYSYSKEEMQKQLDSQFDNIFKEALLNKIVENAEIEFPEAIIDQRVKDGFNRFANYLKSNNMKIEDYMKAYQLTPDMMIKEFKDREELELKRSLVGAEIIKAEDIKATDEEMDAQIKEYAEARKSTPEAIKEMCDKNENFKTALEDQIVSKKLMDFIVENAKVTEETFDEEKYMAEQMAKEIETQAEKKAQSEE